MATDSPIKLKIPVQDLPEFTHFRLEELAAQEWAQGLPVTNTLAVAQQLCRVITDLNRVALPPERRSAILDILLRNQDFALLAGAVGLFLAVALAMALTRHVVWSDVGATPGEPPPPPRPSRPAEQPAA